MMKTPFPFVLAFALLLPAAVPARAGEGGGPSPSSSRFTAQGIAVDLTVEPVGQGSLMEGGTARVRFEITDAATRSPVAGLYPGAWMDRFPDGKKKEEEADACREKVQGFVGGSILNQPTLDLNVYYVLALNEDATISVVDPLFGFGNSKLLSMVFLKSPGEDWALSGDERRLFVSMPEIGQVAAVDTSTWKVEADLDAGPRPGRVMLQPDGQYLWVAHEGGVTAIDARSLRTAAVIPTGKGPYDLAVSDDSRFVFVVNEADGTVAVIDTGALARVANVATGARPVSIAWSKAAQAAYVSHAGDGSIAVVRPGAAEPARIAASSPGLGRLRFAPGGRLGFAVHPEKKQVLILDTASNRVVQTADVEAEPDLVTFSDELAYVRHRGSETVLMIPLDVVGREGAPVPLVDFPGGQNPPGRTSRPSPADGIVQTPGAAAVLVANPLDKAIYFYKEGMAAPMGHFRNYGKEPRAVLVVDRSLRETAPGVYETTVKLGPAGDYDLALLLDTPRLTHCFPVRVAEDPVLAEKRRPALGVEILAQSPKVPVGEEVPVRFRLTDPKTGAARTGVQDARVLTFLTPGIWQQRHWAEDLGEGLYEIRFRPPEPGYYYVFLEVASAGMPFQKNPFLVLQAEEGTKP
ncbi:MAG TPA: YncE family protein [Thermoanaerobaculia bacterium]|nr:YncE family protein [Thermoanaerobaculia bacterium]